MENKAYHRIRSTRKFGCSVLFLNMLLVQLVIRHLVLPFVKTYRQVRQLSRMKWAKEQWNRLQNRPIGKYMIDYDMVIFISYRISNLDQYHPSTFSPHDDMDVSGWYWIWYENNHIITYHIFFYEAFTYTYLYVSCFADVPRYPNHTRRMRLVCSCILVLKIDSKY